MDTLMTDEGQEAVNDDHPIHALSEIISPLRLGTYLNAAGHDPDKALRLYLWNAKIGEAFHIPIQAVEVGLRNRVSDGLANVFGAEWWREEKFRRIAEPRRLDDIANVIQRVSRRKKDLETGQIVAGLSFGFWVSLLAPRYNPPIWGGQLRVAFPHLPSGVSRKDLQGRVRQIADLRNRIWHHEPVFRRNLMADFSLCMKVVGWLCPEKARWIRPHCRVPAIMREKP